MSGAESQSASWRKRQDSTESCFSDSDNLLVIDERTDSCSVSSLSSSSPTSSMAIIEDQDGNPSDPEVEDDYDQDKTAYDDTEGSCTGRNSPLAQGCKSTMQSGTSNGKDGRKEADTDDQNNEVSAREASIVLNSKKLSTPKIGRAILGKVLQASLKKQKAKKNDPPSGNGSTSDKDEGSRLSAEKTDDSEGENEGKIRVISLDKILRKPQLYGVRESVVEKVSTSVMEKVSEPVGGKVSEPVGGKVSESVGGKVSKPVVEKVSIPVAEKVSEPVVEKVSRAATEKVEETVARSNAQLKEGNLVEPEAVSCDFNVAPDTTEGIVGQVSPQEEPMPVAKKSCSGGRGRRPKKRKYLSESDDPISTQPVNTEIKKKKKHRKERSTELSSSASSDEYKDSRSNSQTRSDYASSQDEDDEPLIERLRREAREAGITKEMPKPPVFPKKKKKYQEDSKPKVGEKRTGSESGNFDEKKKRKSRQSRITLKKTNPHASDEVANAIKNMCDEVEKSNPSFDVLKKGMKTSFAYRKHAYENNPDIHKILKTFPALSDHRILKRDFEKFRQVDLQTLERKLEEPLVLEYHSHFRNNYISPDPIVAAAKEHYKLHSDNKELLRDIQMLCFVLQKFKGKLTGALYSQRSKGDPPFIGVTPTIDIRDTLGSESCKITVYCEGIKFTQVPTFFDGVLCAYAIYWIFNMCYEKKAKPLLEFFDSLIGE